MQTVYSNEKVSLTKDLVFGLSVMTEEGWIPISWLDSSDKEVVKRMIDNDPLFPWVDELHD